MWFTSRNQNATRVGAVIDVGDSKIEVALVTSESAKIESSVVWSHNEPLVNGSTDPSIVFKKGLFNSFAALSKEGVKVLKGLGLSGHIDLIQASLHAPYSITVARNVSFKSTKPVKVTTELVKNLEYKANEDAKQLQSSKLVSAGLKLHPLSSVAIALRLNGYETRYPFKSEAAEVSLCQHISFASFDFLSFLYEARDKYLPNVPIDADSFASLFWRTVSSIAPKTDDCTLLMIGDTVTELVIVREGLPQSSTFIAMGLDHIAAEISSQSGLLKHEAKNVTKNNTTESAVISRESLKPSVTSAIAKYEVELDKLLRTTGDVLALPKPIYIQTECDHELFFASLIEKTATKVTGIKHTVHPVTSEFFACRGIRDASLLSLAYVFHKKLYEDHYLDL